MERKGDAIKAVGIATVIWLIIVFLFGGSFNLPIFNGNTIIATVVLFVMCSGFILIHEDDKKEGE